MPPDSCRPSSGPGQPLAHPCLHGFSCSGASHDSNHAMPCVFSVTASLARSCPRGGGWAGPPSEAECCSIVWRPCVLPLWVCGPLPLAGCTDPAGRDVHVPGSSGRMFSFLWGKPPGVQTRGCVVTGFRRSQNCQTAVHSSYPRNPTAPHRSPTPLITAL